MKTLTLKKQDHAIALQKEYEIEAETYKKTEDFIDYLSETVSFEEGDNLFKELELFQNKIYENMQNLQKQIQGVTNG